MKLTPVLRKIAAYGYDTKPAGSEGLALGAVTLPWVFTALLITDLLKKNSSGKPENVTTKVQPKWLCCSIALLQVCAPTSLQCQVAVLCGDCNIVAATVSQLASHCSMQEHFSIVQTEHGIPLSMACVQSQNI